MTVAELIQRLESFEPEARVDILVIAGRSGRLAEVAGALRDDRGRVRVYGEWNAV
jgi:hypothetical protein